MRNMTRGNEKEKTVMQKCRILIITCMAILMTSVSLAAWSQQGLTYSNGELDTILSPIALYPDPLVAQILPAATYPDQLVNADDLIRQRGGDRDIDRQDWDVSVKAVAHYPSVLHMMVDKPDWTISVGQAYVDEPDHVMWSIQRLRNRARSHGYLSTNRYQRVYLDSGYVRIVPVRSQYIYVPQYDPQIVYVQRRTSVTSNLISFGLGLVIGSWLNRDMDWHRDRVYYHGWSGGGWVGNSRPHVNITNNYYVNSDYRSRPISVDRNVRGRDLGDYRVNIRKNAGSFKLPESRRPSRANITPNGNKSQNHPYVGRNAPNVSNQNNKSNQGAVRRSSPGRTSAPSVRTAPKSNPKSNQGSVRRTSPGSSSTPSVRTAPRSNPKSNQGSVRRSSPARSNAPSVRTAPRSSGKSSQGSVRRSSPGRASAPSVRTVPRSNSKSSQGSVRRSSPARSNAPAVRTTPRSNPRSDQGASKSHASRGSSQAAPSSKSKSGGKDHGGSSHDKKGR